MARPNARCAQCGQPVLRAVTDAQKLQSLNPDPDPAGNTAVYQDGTGTWRARVPTPECPRLPHEKIFMPHPATCVGRPVPRPPAPAPTPIPAELPENVSSLAEHRRKRRGAHR